ncbi:TPA: DUF4231 domain-containing protein [Enterobacter soli]|uniref:DUF4231 domain-containing protein n=1 Tax=Enterobacter soli TaxID=885040 RepID=A0AAW8H9M2_9ENTR|nr:DUF4231 domain-containing protein [Enterobacter soli]MDQ2256169.1 DUF4231 domain-containing protein [Enterobacter soli]MDQ2337730.1 DUF4231 domain-containing protein [Enterobacter soli]HEE9786654.1 DUF4231 domain-containing protein [Enterobacter soli]
MADQEDFEKGNSITLTRLDEQISWYSRKSRHARISYKSLKIIQISISATIPLLSIFIPSQAQKIMAFLGLLLLIIEGIQQLNQYQKTWLTYRSTCEFLKQEKYIFLARAGVYNFISTPEKLLSERIEEIISKEHGQWFSLQTQEYTEGNRKQSG